MKKANESFYSKNKTPVLIGILAVVVLCLLFVFAARFHKQNPASEQKNIAVVQSLSNRQSQNDSAQFMTALTFKHLSIYPFMCEQNGYTMHSYQSAFIATFSKELKKFKTYLSQNNLTEIKAWDRLPENTVRAIFFSVYKELQSLTDAMNKNSSNATPATVKEACAMMDKNAGSLFEEKLKGQVKEKANAL